MPVTFAAMTITGIGLVGIPPFAGFHSKWALATAAVQGGNPVSYLGILALIISALLTALYVFILWCGRISLEIRSTRKDIMTMCKTRTGI